MLIYDTRMHVSTKYLIKTDTRGDIERAGRETRDWPHNGVCEGNGVSSVVCLTKSPSARIATLRPPSAEDKSNGKREKPSARGKDRAMGSADDGGGRASRQTSERKRALEGEPRDHSL